MVITTYIKEKEKKRELLIFTAIPGNKDAIKSGSLSQSLYATLR
jgi:hypothetical protein